MQNLRVLLTKRQEITKKAKKILSSLSKLNIHRLLLISIVFNNQKIRNVSTNHSSGIIFASMNPRLMPYQIGVLDEAPPAQGALKSALRVRPGVRGKQPLGGEALAAVGARQGSIGHVRPPVGHQVALHGKLLPAEVAGVRAFAGVHPFVRVQA